MDRSDFLLERKFEREGWAYVTRVLTYNILFGGTPRTDQIAQIIRSARPDVVGLLEATDPRVVEKLAEQLGMEYRLTGRSRFAADWQVAVLSRLPIVRMRVHLRPGALSKPLLEIGVREEHGGELTLFVTHLTSSFARGARGGDSLRLAEVRELLRITAHKRVTPHLIMGDFNSLAPGDALGASRLLRYLVQMEELPQAKLHERLSSADLNFVVPTSLGFLKPLLRVIPRHAALSVLFDAAASRYVARGSIRLLLRAGYLDCFRQVRPHDDGFTCPARAPAGRIDYIFASPELATRLSACSVVTGADGVFAEQASDHLPVLAEFGVPPKGERDAGDEEA